MSALNSNGQISADFENRRWAYELSPELRLFSIQKCSLSVQPRQQKRAPTRNLLDKISPELSDQSLAQKWSCRKQSKRPQPRQQTELDTSRALTIYHYKMNHTCHDAVQMNQQRREMKVQQMQQVRTDKTELEELAKLNKLKFESVLKVKEVVRKPYREASTMFIDGPSQASRFSLTLPTPEHASKSLKVVPYSEHSRSLEPGRALNHLRGMYKFHPRICRHIQKISSNYRVLFSPPVEVLEKESNVDDYSIGRGYFLVPLKQEPIFSESEKSEDQMEEDMSETLEKSDLEDEDEDIIEQEYLKARSVSLEENQRCWVDDATASSKVEIDVAAEREEDTEDGLAASIIEDVDAHLHAQTSKYSIAIEETPVTEKVSKAMQPVKQQEMTETKALPGGEEDIEEELAPESVTETEKEVEETPRPPSLICPSSVSKSHDAKVKMWLRNSSFSGASRTVPF